MYRRYTLLLGIFVKLANALVPVKKNTWIFGSFHGKDFREGSKYMLEYVSKNHPEIDATFITQNKETQQTVRALGYKCLMNTSLQGINKLVRAECVLTTQDMTSDIIFVTPKKNRRIYYLIHGQSLKKAFKSLPDGYVYDMLNVKQSKIERYFSKLYKVLCYNVEIKDISFVSATSEFLKPFTEMDFGRLCEVKILGSPRIDVFFDHKKIQKETWLNITTDKFIITYMPTHRKYGVGEASPNLFEGNAQVEAWLEQNNVVLLIKNHPNMLSKVIEGVPSKNILDITKTNIDPQVLLYHTNVLITDFSSVWIDYLILKRPIIYYLYDDFEKADVGCHYDIREDCVGHVCQTEQELFQLFQQMVENYDSMCPTDQMVQKFHTYQDDHSCERHFQEMIKTQN
jgi:CDP-glycerol glycerophosphotransferase